MAVLYDQNKGIGVPEGTPESTKWFLKLYKLRILVPIFPKDPDHQESWWYKLSYTIVLILSLWFYGLGLFFIYLGMTDKNNMVVFLGGALAWILAGLIMPPGLYRLTIFLLNKKKLLD